MQAEEQYTQTSASNAYLATVTDLYHSDRYQQGRALVFNRWPHFNWIEPARMGWDLDTWKAEWPKIVTTLELLAVIPRSDSSIGRGVWREITDCVALNIPVWVLIGDQWVDRFHLEYLPGGMYRRWAKVVHHDNY